MKRLALLLITLIVSTSAYPCGNEYGYHLDGTRIYTRYFFLSKSMMHFDTTYINKRLNDLYKKTEDGTADYKTWSDIAANLMKIGQADSGIKILRPLLKERPTEYNLLANLGTCYELTGQLDSALKYISKGYELNPSSHRGSEWIHIKILEAKIKDKQRPGWIKNEEIVKAADLIERTKNDPRHRASRKVNDDFFYQIRTRVRFTPPPNRTIANLLTSLGDFNREAGTYENALLAYTYALRFEPAHYLQRKVKGKIKSLNKEREAQPKINELPETFLKMMKRSQIDPEVLLLGLDDYAEQLDSAHLSEINERDTLSMVQQQKDSLTALLSQKAAEQQEAMDSEKTNRYLFLSIGIFIGLVVAIALSRMLRNRKNN